MKPLKNAGMILLAMITCLGAMPQSTLSLVNVTPPSPAVQAMQKFGDIPVSPYTGVPNISIPIFTAKFRDISIPISIDYHNSGIKVAEEASQVGLGWVLSAGGSISRNVVGDDDFDGTAYLTDNLPDLDSGLTYQGIVQYGCTLQLINGKYPLLPTLYSDTLTSVLGGGYPVDWQPDQYYYNILGKSGKFTLRHNGQVLLENQEKLDISFSAGGASWEVKDEHGYIYDFTRFETYQSTSGSTSQVKSAWYLTQITSPGGNKATLNYTALTANFEVPVGSYYETDDVYQLPILIQGNAVNDESIGNHYGLTPAMTYYPLLLTNIDFTNGVVQFNYSGNRTDLPGDERLDSVSIYEKNTSGTMAATPIKTFRLYYSYFFGEQYAQYHGNTGLDTAMDPETTRLRLDSVQNIGYYGGLQQSEPPYKFNYIDTTPSAAPSKNSLARDHWGYYNGQIGNTTLVPSTVGVTSSDYIQELIGAPGPERNTDTLYSKIFSLSSITYPTGGSTEFQMESNDYDLAASQVNDHTTFSFLESTVPEVSSTGYDAFNQRMYSDSIMDMSSEYYYSNNGFVPISIQVTVRMASSGSSLYRLNNTGLIYFSFLDSSGNVHLSKDLGDLGICDQEDTTACLMDNGGVYTFTYTNVYLPPNKYTVRAYVSPIFDTSVVDFLINVNWQAIYGTTLVEENGITGQYGFAGGLRARRVIQHDGVCPANDQVKHYIYHYTADKGQGPLEYSYGRRMARPQYFYFDWVASSESDNSAGNPTTASLFFDHLFRSADSQYQLNGSAGETPVGYDQVTVLEGDTGQNGKTVYTYYNQPDVINDYSYLDGLPHRPPAHSTTQFQMNGTQLSKTNYANVDGTFYKVKESIDGYNDYPTRQNVLYGVEIRPPLNDGSYVSSSDCSNILLFYPGIISQWNTLVEHDEITYNKPTDTIDNVTTRKWYYYDNPAHFLPTRVVTWNSMGDTITTTTKYPLDYSSAATGDAFNNGIVKLDSAHVIDAPVEAFQQHSLVGGSGPFVSKGVLTSFSPNLPKPSLEYALQIASPDYSYAPGSISNGTSSIDHNYISRISFDQYDSNANLVQQHKVSDLSHAYVYDYNNAIPIAEVTNAQVSDIAYTSFESNGSGGWTIPGSARVTGGITGAQSYTVTSGAPITKTGLNSATTYIVSYWSKNGALTVNGSTGTAGTVVGAWTYYEDSVSGSSTITVAGNGTTIDELRLFPKNSLMTTTTFDPLIGATSQCNPTNYITYYGYDGLGRLAFIKDMRGNLIKTYNYHYK